MTQSSDLNVEPLVKIANLLAYESLRNAGLLEKTKVEQFQYLEKFGFTLTECCQILETTERSLKELVRQKQKKVKTHNGK